MDDKQYKWLCELLRDADACNRLSRWEQDFIDSITQREAQYGSKLLLSDAQIRVLKNIEKTVYMT